MAKVLLLLSAVALAMVVLACRGDAQPADTATAPTIVREGILSVVFDDGCEAPHGCCAIPEGCGPTFKLLDPDLDRWIPLGGELNKDDWDRLIRIEGRSEFTEIDCDNCAGPTQAVIVDSYEVLGKLRYQDFLGEASSEYLRENYPCLLTERRGTLFATGNRTNSWELDGDRPILKARLTDTDAEGLPQPFIELSFDANSGEFLEETREPADLQPCP